MSIISSYWALCIISFDHQMRPTHEIHEGSGASEIVNSLDIPCARISRRIWGIRSWALPADAQAPGIWKNTSINAVRTTTMICSPDPQALFEQFENRFYPAFNNNPLTSLADDPITNQPRTHSDKNCCDTARTPNLRQYYKPFSFIITHMFLNGLEKQRIFDQTTSRHI